MQIRRLQRGGGNNYFRGITEGAQKSQDLGAEPPGEGGWAGEIV